MIESELLLPHPLVKVYDLYLKQVQEAQTKMKEAQEKGERPQFDREAMQKQREANEAALKEILTPEQMEAYNKAQQQRQQRRGGMRGGRQGQPNGELNTTDRPQRRERPQQ